MSEPAAVAGPGGTFIGPPAGKLGIRPATLRKWERTEPLGAALRDWHGRLSGLRAGDADRGRGAGGVPP